MSENILTIIDELGVIISKYKDDIKYKDIEIEHLRKKIESIESYIDFYTDNKITDQDYKEVIK